MVYEIEYSDEARQQLNQLPIRWKKTVKAGVEIQLRHDPGIETRNRKPLRQPNSIAAAWELRLPPYRVYYNIH